MMKSTQQQQQLLQPPTLDENILFNNLCLLGLTPQVGAKHGVEISRLMFRKPNTKAMELILYWLYGICKGKSAAKKELKNIWPIIDHKVQKEFHQKIQDWFRELKQAGDLEIMANSTISALRNAQGTRLVSLLSELSYLALCAHHSAQCPDDTKAVDAKAITDKDARVLLPLDRTIMVVLEQNLQEEYQQFLALLQKANALQRESEELAATLLNYNYDRAAYIRKLQAAQPSPDGPEVQGQREHNLKLAEERWRRLEEQLSLFPVIMELLKGITGSATHPHAIDGFLLTELSMETTAGRPAVSRTQSRPVDTDICTLLEVWMTQLQQLGAQTKELAGMGSTGSKMSPLATGSGAESHVRELVGNLSLHRMNLSHLLDLKAKLSSDLAQADAEQEMLKGAVQQAVVTAQEKVAATGYSDGRSTSNGGDASVQPSLPPVPRTPMPNPAAVRKAFPFVTYTAGGSIPSSSLDAIAETALTPAPPAPSPMDTSNPGAAFSPSPLLAPSGFPPAPGLAASPQDVHMSTPVDARRLDFNNTELGSPDLPFGNFAAAAQSNGAAHVSSSLSTSTPLPASPPACVSPDSPTAAAQSPNTAQAGPMMTPPEVNPMLSPLLMSADSPMLWLLTDTCVTADIGESIDATLHRMKHATGHGASNSSSSDVANGANRETRGKEGVSIVSKVEDSSTIQPSAISHYDILASLELLQIGGSGTGIPSTSSQSGTKLAMEESQGGKAGVPGSHATSSSAGVTSPFPGLVSSSAAPSELDATRNGAASIPQDVLNGSTGTAVDAACDMDIDADDPVCQAGANDVDDDAAKQPCESVPLHPGGALPADVTTTHAGGEGQEVCSASPGTSWNTEQPLNTALSQLLEAESSTEDLPSGSDSGRGVQDSTATSGQSITGAPAHARMAARALEVPNELNSSGDHGRDVSVSDGGDGTMPGGDGAASKGAQDTQANTLEMLRQRFQNVKQKKADLLQGMKS